MKTKFINAINSGNFFIARQLLENMSFEVTVSFLIDLTFATNHIGIYTFILFLLLDNENISFHELAINVLSVSMWEGANAAAFLHARRIVELAPTNIKYRQHLLTYFGIPDCIMSVEEAIDIAKKILEQDSTNVIALKAIDQIVSKGKI